MSVSFIDRNRKDEYYDHEVIMRCDCGCSFLSIRTRQLPGETIEEFLPVMEFVLFPSDGKINSSKWGASKAAFVGDGEIIKRIVTSFFLTDPNFNNGYIDIYNRVIATGISENRDSLDIIGFNNIKDFNKFQKKHDVKYVAWNVHLSKKEALKAAQKLSDAIKDSFNYIVDENANNVEE